jgi:hypothetical protein
MQVLPSSSCSSGQVVTQVGYICSTRNGCTFGSGQNFCLNKSSAQPVLNINHQPASSAQIDWALNNLSGSGLSQQRMDYLNSLPSITPIPAEIEQIMNITGPAFVDLPSSSSSSTSSTGTSSTSSTNSRVNLSYSGSSITASTSSTTSSTSSGSSGGTTGGSVSSTTTSTNSTPVTITKTQSGTSENLVTCDKYPNSSGCVELGTPQSSETIKNTSFQVNITPKTLVSSATCPPPVPLDLNFLGAHVSTTLTYQPACDIAVLIKSAVLLLAALYSSYIFTNSFKV